MIYLTYNDPPSGVYFSQATDVCRFLNKELKADIRLVALISLRKFFQNKKKIKAELSNAIVLPMFPKVLFWRMNRFILFLLFLWLRPKKVIARGPFATLLAMDLKKLGIVEKVCFDSRGAFAAEVMEYGVIKTRSIQRSIEKIEKRAVIESDFRMAVSNKLVEYWREKFSYAGDKHVVIPCTLSTLFVFETITEERIEQIRSKLGVSKDEVLLVYSGASSGWQSFQKTDKILGRILQKNPNYKVVFLAPTIPEGLAICEKYPERVFHQWVDHCEVSNILTGCDYGLLLREKSVTNQVAFPVKFAEYLASGLPVLISENIGDVSEFVSKNHCGIVFFEGSQTIEAPERPSLAQKMFFQGIAKKYFIKKTHRSSYLKILENLQAERD